MDLHFNHHVLPWIKDVLVRIFVKEKGEEETIVNHPFERIYWENIMS